MRIFSTKLVTTLLSFSFLVFTCKSDPKEETVTEENMDSVEETVSDDYTGNDGESEEKQQDKGKITLMFGGSTEQSITNFGNDPYCTITWFTPESGATPMVGVVFKSQDFEKSVNVTISNIDTMTKNISGTYNLENGIAGFNAGMKNYIFTSGKVEVEEFSRETGKIKLTVTGKCTYNEMGNPSALKQDINATLVIDATSSNLVVDGTKQNM